MKKLKKILFTSLKIGLSVLLLYFVFRKVPFNDALMLIKNCNFGYLFLALLAFVASQWMSSQRLLQYFRANEFYLKSITNWKLYLVGMFYNFFIPGGIGGDAYKIYVLNKKLGYNTKKLTASVFCDRLSGLMAIVVLLEILCISIIPSWWKILVLPTVFLTVFLGKIILDKIFPTFKKIILKTLFYSVVVQILQLICVYFILNSFASVEDIWIYFMVFLVSSVLSIVSFSGIGVREWLFMKAAQLYTFSLDVSVSTALIFSVITAVVALVGVIYQLKRIELEVEE